MNEQQQRVYYSRWKIGNRESEGESFCIEHIVAALGGDIKDIGFRIFFDMHKGELHVFNKNLKVYIYML